MNRAVKMLFYLSITTLINLIITAVYFILFFVGLVLLDKFGFMAESMRSFIIILPLGLSMLCSFFTYRSLLKWAIKKWKLERFLQ